MRSISSPVAAAAVVTILTADVDLVAGHAASTLRHTIRGVGSSCQLPWVLLLREVQTITSPLKGLAKLLVRDA